MRKAHSRTVTTGLLKFRNTPKQDPPKQTQAYVNRVLDGSAPVSTPLAPAEATWLDAAHLRDAAAAALNFQTPRPPDNELRLAVIAAARRPFEARLAVGRRQN